MGDWQDIKTAPLDRPVFLACFRDGQVAYAAKGEWATYELGYIQRATASGWHVECPPLEVDQMRPSHRQAPIGLWQENWAYAPTHWAEMPAPVAQEQP